MRDISDSGGSDMPEIKDGTAVKNNMAGNRLEVLISALGQEPEALAEKMGLECDAVLIDQTDRDSDRLFMSGGHTVHCIEMKGRGVGLSRNTAIDNIDEGSRYVLFADDDIRYDRGYCGRILGEFADHPAADMILFNVEVCRERRTYHNEKWKRVRLCNSGRYPAYSIAVRSDRLLGSGVRFSLLFGGGAKFSCGEDSLFLRECLKAGIRIYASPVCIGREEVRQSTWFCGYSEKYFKDKGVLYYYMYGPAAGMAARYYLARHKAEWCTEVAPDRAYELLCEGIAAGRTIRAQEGRK
jgi:glycosyltransferase involved in cell wall biosynthesis